MIKHLTISEISLPSTILVYRLTLVSFPSAFDSHSYLCKHSEWCSIELVYWHLLLLKHLTISDISLPSTILVYRLTLVSFPSAFDSHSYLCKHSEWCSIELVYWHLLLLKHLTISDISLPSTILVYRLTLVSFPSAFDSHSYLCKHSEWCSIELVYWHLLLLKHLTISDISLPSTILVYRLTLVSFPSAFDSHSYLCKHSEWCSIELVYWYH